MTAQSICLSLGNAARSAEQCAAMCRSSKPPKPEAAKAQDRLAAYLWNLSHWWGGLILGPAPTPAKETL